MERKIYCFWTGSNSMSDCRKNSLDSMEAITGCKVLCIYKDDVKKYILPEHPLHEAYEYLSETHKADYLRTYFMHFYGGGYSDIKRSSGSWLKAFDDLENSDKWINGYSEITPLHIAGPPEAQERFREFIGNGAYICKPGTPFTHEWYSEMLKTLDRKLEMLKKYPSTFPQDRAEVSGGKYPLGWVELLGFIFHRTSYRNLNKLMNTLPSFLSEDYR